ncbi:MAG: histidine phosphatase family protein [Acidimicrobiia bacterium]|nr:histidine phosphatase family protein [Acidimicrobiia bacterium]
MANWYIWAMSTTTIHLVRHGDSTGHTGDAGLTDQGRRQAEAVGHRLAGLGVDELLHGSHRRTAETAEIVAATAGITTVHHSPYAEDRTPIPDDWSTVPAHHHHWLQDIPDDERDLGAANLEAAIHELAYVVGHDRSIAVVTHNFVVGWFVRHALDAPWWRWIGLNADHGALTTIQWMDDQAPTLITFNDRGHLVDHQG